MPKPENPLSVYINPKAKKGLFRVAFKKDGNTDVKEKEDFEFTVLAALYTVTAKGMNNPDQLYSNYFSQFNDPIQVYRRPKGQGGAEKIVAFDQGQSYTTCKDIVKAAGGTLALHLIGFVKGGFLAQIELSGTNLYHFNQIKRKAGIDFAETPTITLSYSSGTMIPNPAVKGEKLHVFAMGATELSEANNDLFKTLDLEALGLYLDYRKMTETIAKVKPEAQHLEESDVEQPAPESSDVPPNFPTVEKPTETEEVEEEDDDLPF